MKSHLARRGVTRSIPFSLTLSRRPTGHFRRCVGLHTRSCAATRISFNEAFGRSHLTDTGDGLLANTSALRRREVFPDTSRFEFVFLRPSCPSCDTDRCQVGNLILPDPGMQQQTFQLSDLSLIPNLDIRRQRAHRRHLQSSRDSPDLHSVIPPRRQSVSYVDPSSPRT